MSTRVPVWTNRRCYIDNAAPRLFLITVAFVSLSGCGSKSDASAESDWTNLIEDNVTHCAVDDQHSTASYICAVELSNQRFREIGLEFWRNYPNDPRRYQWLTVTMHLAPTYPVDIKAWARAEALELLAPNTVEIDSTRLAGWRAILGELKDDFLSADEVTPEERRFLLFGELRLLLRDARYAADRGEEFSIQPILDGLAAFVSTYNAPFSDGDQHAYEWMVISLIRELMQHANIFSLTAEQRFDFKESIESGVRGSLEIWKISADDWSGFLDEAAIQERASRKTGVRSWGEFDQQFPHVMRELFFQPSTRDSEFVRLYTTEILKAKYRAAGIKLWGASDSGRTSSKSHLERFNWLARTTQFGPLYIERPMNGTGHVAALLDDNVGFGVEGVSLAGVVKTQSQDHWQTAYKKYREELWRDHRTSVEQRRVIRDSEIDAILNQVVLGVVDEVNREEAVAYVLSGIHDLHLNYDIDAEVTLKRTMMYVDRVIRYGRALGLDAADVERFVRPMMGYDEAISSFVDDWLKAYETTRQEPLQLRLRTIGGDDFDLADLRGKIVLLDVWASSCASCIAAFPRIQTVYNEYKKYGFEVVSIGLDAKSNLRRVERIKAELGLSWTSLDGEEKSADLGLRLGLIGVPHYMLLDRRGILYAGTEEVNGGRNLAALLDEMLVVEAAEKEAATVH